LDRKKSVTLTLRADKIVGKLSVDEQYQPARQDVPRRAQVGSFANAFSMTRESQWAGHAVWEDFGV